MADKPPNLDPHPLDPNANNGDSDGGTNPDDGKDLNYLVPNVSVGWDKPPSFNLDPGNQSGGGPPPDSVAAGGPFAINLQTVRTGEVFMLGAVRNTVDEYEQLKGTVQSSSTVFGPQPVAEHQLDLVIPHTQVLETGGHGGPWSTNPNNKGLTDDEKEINKLADAGHQFEAKINPMQEKLLENIANLCELTGQYITVINGSGQAYSATDRVAKFPDPPAGSPTA